MPVNLKYRYRLFVDEVGNNQPEPPKHPQSRFIALTGVIMGAVYSEGTFVKKFDALRGEHFGHSDQTKVILHRREMVAKTGPFKCLQDDEKRLAWEAASLDFHTKQPYRIITSVMDKQEFYKKHKNWDSDPYSLCMSNLVERYFYFLRGKNGIGDIFAESRNQNDNDRVQLGFASLLHNGSFYISADKIQTHIRTEEIKFIEKSDDVPGVQMADLWAQPSFLACKETHCKEKDDKELSEFCKKLIKLLEDEKYYRRLGIVTGHGRVWRPRS